MINKINIHFVCRGNIHRSRLAEAYAKSLLGSNWEVSSSGIDADKYPAYFISPWTKILCDEHGLSEYLSDHTTQTSSELLQIQDIIIFLNPDIVEEAKSKYVFNISKCIVWKVKDREDWSVQMSLHDKRQKTYREISRQIKELVKDLNQGGWVDVVDDDNKPLGYSLPIRIADKNSVWHRSCHAIITTPSKKTLIEKRSNNIVFAPKLIDISLGGHVDPSESPETAVIREIYEEIGIRITAADLKLLDIYKRSSYHPKYKVHTRSFVYAYHVQLQKEELQITLQKAEVASVKLLTPAQLKRLLKYGRLKNVGQLNYPRELYKKITKLAGVV